MSLFRKITETVSKGVSTATEKAQQTMEITRIHSQISAKRKEIENLYTNIGQAVFEGYLAKDLSLAEAKVIPACEEVVAIRSEIEALDERIMLLRNEKECVCGRKVTYDMRFCPSCGHKFPEPAIQAAEPEQAGNNKPPYEDDSPSADAFAEPPGFREFADSPSASDWADVGKPVREERPDSDWTQASYEPHSTSDWSDSGLPPRGGRTSPPDGEQGTNPAAPAYSTDLEQPKEQNSETTICRGCGSVVDPSARFCPSCGSSQH